MSFREERAELKPENAELKAEVRELIWGTGKVTPAPARPRPIRSARVAEEEVEKKIGEFMGVDWRTLIGPIHQLIETGAVRKEDKIYFPSSGGRINSNV
ncbi:MAG: hypothetical protein ACE5JU_19480 [Candidatus Binatia bacterium]